MLLSQELLLQKYHLKIVHQFFTKYIPKIDGATTDDADDLDLVMPMCILIEYSSNCSKTTQIL